MRWAGAMVCAVIAAGCGARETPAPPDGVLDARPVAHAPRLDGRFLVARLQRPTELRDRPGGRRLAKLETHTSFGSPTVLAVTRRRGRWLAVLTPHRRRPGWIPAGAAQLDSTDRWVRIDRSARRLELRDGDRVLRRIRVAVGRPGYPTPIGRFAVTDKLRMDGAGPYGCCAVALTGRQTRLPPGWQGGDRLAIHGTRAPESIGKAASLGCVRATDSAVRALMRAVPLGAPVIVRS